MDQSRLLPSLLPSTSSDTGSSDRRHHGPASVTLPLSSETDDRIKPVHYKAAPGRYLHINVDMIERSEVKGYIGSALCGRQVLIVGPGMVDVPVRFATGAVKMANFLPQLYELLSMGASVSVCDNCDEIVRLRLDEMTFIPFPYEALVKTHGELLGAALDSKLKIASLLLELMNSPDVYIGRKMQFPFSRWDPSDELPIPSEINKKYHSIVATHSVFRYPKSEKSSVTRAAYLKLINLLEHNGVLYTEDSNLRKKLKWVGDIERDSRSVLLVRKVKRVLYPNESELNCYENEIKGEFSSKHLYTARTGGYAKGPEGIAPLEMYIDSYSVTAITRIDPQKLLENIVIPRTKSQYWLHSAKHAKNSSTYMETNSRLKDAEAMMGPESYHVVIEEQKWNPLHVAALAGNQAAFTYFLGKGVNSHAPDIYGKTPWNYAHMLGLNAGSGA